MSRRFRATTWPLRKTFSKPPRTTVSDIPASACRGPLARQRAAILPTSFHRSAISAHGSDTRPCSASTAFGLSFHTSRVRNKRQIVCYRYFAACANILMKALRGPLEAACCVSSKRIVAGRSVAGPTASPVFKTHYGVMCVIRRLIPILFAEAFSCHPWSAEN